MGEIGRNGALIAATEDDDYWNRVYAIASLGAFRGEAEAIVPTLLKLLREDDPKGVVRSQAAGTLERFAAKADMAVPHLLEMVRLKTDTTLRAKIVSIFATVGARDKKIERLLIELLQDKKEDLLVRSCAAYALGIRQAECAIPLLTETLNISDGANPEMAANLRKAAESALYYMHLKKYQPEQLITDYHPTADN